MRTLISILIFSLICCAQTPVKGHGKISGTGSILNFVPTSISVTPFSLGAPTGTNTAPFTATFNDSAIVDPSGLYTASTCLSSGWSSTNTGVATINASTGVATAIAAGTTTIQCAAGGLTGSATLTVESAPNFTNPATPCNQPCPLNNGTVGITYGNSPLTASGATPPYTFSASGQPSWLSLSSTGCGVNTGCQLTGTPNGTGTTTFTLTVTDSLNISTNLSVSITIGAAAGTGVTLPQAWATKVISPTFNVTRALGPLGTNFYTCSSGDTCFAALQQAYCDWAFDGADDNWNIVIQHGTLWQTGQPHTCTQTGSRVFKTLTIIPKIVNGARPTGVWVVDSDTPLTAGQTVCSHNTDDTGTRQPPSGDISTWWTGSNYGCSNDRSSMWVGEANWASPGNFASLIEADQWDATTNLGPTGVVFKNGEMRMLPGLTAGGTLVSSFPYNGGSGPTQVSQMSQNWHFENIYAHADGKDWCNAVGGITQYYVPVSGRGTGYAKNDTGMINTGGGNATYVVNTVTSGGASLVTLTNAGSGYSVGSNVATTATTGSGSGMTLNILATAASSPSCVTSFNTGGTSTNRLVIVFRLQDCGNCSLKYSYVDYIATSGVSESHGVAIARGPGPIAIVHNWLSGSSIELFTGGESSSDPLYTLTNLEFRGNRISNPPSLIGTPYLGPNLSFKNGVELKVGQNVLVDGNIAEYSDESGQQNGQCYEFNPRPCSAGLQCDNPQLVIQEITATNNICRHALAGFSVVGRSGYPANGGGVAPGLKDVFINNNLVYDQGNSNLYDHFNLLDHPYPVRFSSAGQAFVCSGTRSGSQITLTCAQGPTGLSQTQIQVGDYFTVQGCSDTTWNLPASVTNFSTGAVALAGTIPAGLTVVYNNPAAVAASATNCVVFNEIGYPKNVTFSHNTMVMDTTAAGANNGIIYGGVPGGVYSDTGCSGAGPQHSTAITSLTRTNNVVTASVASLTGWTTLNNAGSVVVEVSGMTPADLNGKFNYLGTSGSNVTWFQAGASETGTAFGTVAQMYNNCKVNLVAQNAIFKNNLAAVNLTSAPSCNTPATGWQGWIAQGTSNVEGCPSGFNANGCSENMLDQFSSVATYADFPGRCASKYTEMGGANAGQRPPVTLSFPAATVCPGATADATCVGLHDMMNGVPFDGNNATFTNYVLDSTSVYHNAADDGTDYGANPAAIETANQSTLYVCATSCGTGPNPDK